MVVAAGRMFRVGQPVLPLLPADARPVGPSAGLAEGPDGGVVFVLGQATFTYGLDDSAGRRLAAVQLVRLKLASAVEVAAGFAVSEGTVWRWVAAARDGGVSALVTDRPGPRGPSKLTDALRAQIIGWDGEGMTLAQIADRAGVSTATVRVALGRVTGRETPACQADRAGRAGRAGQAGRAGRAGRAGIGWDR